MGIIKAILASFLTVSGIVASAPGGGQPTGTVTFTIDGRPQAPAPLQLVNGEVRADLAIPSLGAGKHTIGASYDGTAAFAVSTAAPLDVQVRPQASKAATSTRLDIAPRPSTFGQSVILTATAIAGSGTGTPTGKVTLTVDGKALTAVDLRLAGGKQQATFTLRTLSPGRHSFVARYAGNALFGPSEAARAHEVNRAPSTTALASTPNPALAGQRVTLTATVFDKVGVVPTGSVTFFDGARKLGTVALRSLATAAVRARQTTGGASATFSLTMGDGRHSLRAVYGGNAVLTPSSSASVTQVVNRIPPPGGGDGPQVVDVTRFGIHGQPTLLVVTFDRPLDPATAADPANYTIVTVGGPGRGGRLRGRVIPVVAADYEAGALRVALSPSERLDVHNAYRLTINGASPGGVSDTSGRLLDGLGAGAPGSDFSTNITRSTLAGPAASAFDELATSGQLASVFGAIRRRAGEYGQR